MIFRFPGVPGRFVIWKKSYHEHQKPRSEHQETDGKNGNNGGRNPLKTEESEGERK